MHQIVLADSELIKVVQSWDQLSDQIKKAILTLCQTES